jgi:hypothetical protein
MQQSVWIASRGKGRKRVLTDRRLVTISRRGKETKAVGWPSLGMVEPLGGPAKAL